MIWRDGILTVDRRGAVSSRIVFRTGETVGVDLTIPPLSIPLTVTTEEVLLLPTPNGVGFRVLFSSVISGERRRTEMTVVATPV